MSTSIIKINRGDSFEYPITITKKYSSDKYLLTENEVAYFALLFPHQPFEDSKFIKGFTAEDQNKDTGEITIKLTPSETRWMAPSVYYYTVKLQRGGTPGVFNDVNNEPEEFRTVVERTKFIVNE